jgi:hypothetical protein
LETRKERKNEVDYKCDNATGCDLALLPTDRQRDSRPPLAGCVNIITRYRQKMHTKIEYQGLANLPRPIQYGYEFHGVKGKLLLHVKENKMDTSIDASMMIGIMKCPSSS